MNITQVEQLAYDLSEKLNADEITVLVTFLRFIQHGMNLAGVQNKSAHKPVKPAPVATEADDEPPWEEPEPEPPAATTTPRTRGTRPRGRPAKSSKSDVVEDNF
jgi:hypothetical protein